MKKINSLLVALWFSIPAFAQDVEMADTLRSEGKIYVVVSILLIILVGLIVYLSRIDQKVGRLEKKLWDKKSS